MQQVIYQESNKIEIALSEELTEGEFRQVIHQLESLCTMHQEINVLFDAVNLEKYDFKIFIEEFDFYKQYKNHLKRVALVTNKGLKIEAFMVNMFNKFTNADFKTFEGDQIEAARKWIFPSNLP